MQTTPPPPTIGVHPRIVRINTTPPPTQNRPGETQHRRRFVHNRCPAWPPRRPLTLADLRIADNTPAPIIGAKLRIADNGGAANYGWTPTDLPSGRWGFAKADNTDLRPGETVAGYRPSSTSTRPPQAAGANADLRIVDNPAHTHHWPAPTNCTNRRNSPAHPNPTWANAAALSIRAQPVLRTPPLGPLS